MNRSMPGLHVHHQLPEFTQTHVHRVSDAIQPSHPLSSPSFPMEPSLSLRQKASLPPGGHLGDSSGLGICWGWQLEKTPPKTRPKYSFLAKCMSLSACTAPEVIWSRCERKGLPHWFLVSLLMRTLNFLYSVSINFTVSVRTQWVNERKGLAQCLAN